MRFIFAILLLLSQAAGAQEKIIASIENNKPYITKKVAAGETIYSLGRNYTITAKDLAAFNKIDITKSLKLGQNIKVPLTKANLFLAPCKVCKQVFYVVPQKEGLFRIAANFNNMGLANLKKLNNLSVENVAIGQELTVGYLKDVEGQAIIISTIGTEPTKVEVKEIVPPQKEPVKKAEEEVVAVKETVLDAGMTQISDRIPDVVKSAFASQFTGKVGFTTIGTSAIFKSTSGWNDHKYYVLMNNVAPGTIVKITSPNTAKALYAKVLGELPAIKQNDSLLIRISNAAASALGGGEESMAVSIHY